MLRCRGNDRVWSLRRERNIWNRACGEWESGRSSVGRAQLSSTIGPRSVIFSSFVQRPGCREEEAHCRTSQSWSFLSSFKGKTVGQGSLRSPVQFLSLVATLSRWKQKHGKLAWLTQSQRTGRGRDGAKPRSPDGKTGLFSCSRAEGCPKCGRLANSKSPGVRGSTRWWKCRFLGPGPGINKYPIDSEA